jgi:hypothetical protein
MACARVEKCPLFAQFKMKSSLKVWQSFYCEGDFNRCERFKRAARGETVPQNLLPNGKNLTVPLHELEPYHLA